MILQEKWFAVVNPQSASGKTKDRWPMLYQRILKADIQVDYAYTASQGDGIELTRKAISQGHQKIIAVGGDGTVNEVVNGILTHDQTAANCLELAIFGQGTGSDFIRTLQFPNNLDSFVKILKHKATRQIDVGKVTLRNPEAEMNSRYFLNVSNLGLGAEIVHRVNNRTKFLGSKLAYLTGTIATIIDFPKPTVSLQVKTTQPQRIIEVEGTYCGLMICNGQYIGGGMQIAPNAQIDDGSFDLVLIKNTSKARLFSRFPLIYKGKHLNLPEIEVYPCQALTVVSPESVLVEVDGEIIGTTPCEYQIIPQCITLRI